MVGGGREARESPLATLTSIQFGILNAEDIMTFSVFEKDHSINGTKDLWDGRLGVYNLPGNRNICLTCGAKKASDCEGHFGHIVLPREVYHPLHIRFLKNVLNRICLVCHRLKEKKDVKRGTQEERTTWLEITRQLKNVESPNSGRDIEIVGLKKSGSSKTAFNIDEMSTEEFYAMSMAEVADFMEELDRSESLDNGAPCKYCGAKMAAKDRYPNLEVALSREVDRPYETIEMRACAKDGKVPQDYWTFVQGNPRGCHKNIRPLLPFEALNILRKLSGNVILKLGMDAVVARPEALILSRLPLPPTGSRINEVDVGSCLPRTHADKQHMHLQRLSSVVNKVQTQSIGKPKFAAYQSEVMELQMLASNYLNGSKWENGLKYQRYNPVKQDVEKDDKLMKSVLAKINNSSARMIVVGDPSIKIEEILLPVFLVEQLTIPEMVTTFNRNRLQQYLDNGPYASLNKTGALYIDKPGEGLVDLRRRRLEKKLEIEIGDTIHRHIKDGDLVIVNRAPSLTKHSIMAMQVRLHKGCSSAINPLICPSFQADFDGDSMHIFIPQSLESRAELQSLMGVSDQLINPQGGQSNNVLAEDSRLGAYLITNSCLFLNKTEMSHLSISSSILLPIPAILKSPKINGPLWTGQQLYSTVLPKGICYRAPDKKFNTDVKRGILIRDGELLVCGGKSNWLGSAPDALTAVISKIQGPAAALAYLNRVQELANMYLRDRGFSVGLEDFQLTRNRSHLLSRRLEEVSRGNREALTQTLLEDQNVQRKELKNNPVSQKGLSGGIQCSNTKGLFLGTLRRSEALDKVAIERFQKKFGQTTDRLARDFCKKSNPLLVMINAGSKGSMSKLVSQTISLGLQLYKGEHLLPWSAQDLSYQRQLTGSSSSRVLDLLRFDQVANFSGYWESRGIITSSYLDGLSPLQFFTHTIASRYGMLRSKVEEPNMLRNRLLLFLRSLYVGYDSSVRSLEGQQIVQFEYGGLLETDGQGTALKASEWPTDICEAGEAVGILAATALTEPAYQLKLDSPHNVGAQAIGPLDLIKETLSSCKAVLLVDRRVLLRMPLALRKRHHGQEKGAIRIAQHLKPVTLDMVTSTTMIEYRKTSIEVEEHGRRSPWVGHIRLNVEKLEVHQVLGKELFTRLENRHSTTCSFSSSNKCRFGSSQACQDEPEPCIHFFTKVSPSISALDDEEYNEHMSALLEVTKVTLLPILMRTIVKGDDRIQSVTLLWEDMDWSPRCLKIPLWDSCKHESGEVVVEVTVKKNDCKLRGKAWEIVKEACLPIMQLLDWQRCTPYSVREVCHVLGVEAAKGVLLQRLELAAAGMGKRVNTVHLKLIADSLVTSGEVNGATLSGYKDLCKSISLSAPFSDAAFQNPKNSFISAARHGACETIDGALASSVWGKTPSLGTGSSFVVVWEAKVEEKPALKIQQGVDIHECIAKINFLIPTGSCVADSALYRLSTRERVLHHMRPSKGSHHPGVDGRRFTKGDLNLNKIGDRRPSRMHVDRVVTAAPSKLPSQPNMARAGNERNFVNYDLKRGSKRSHRVRTEENTNLFRDSTVRSLKASSQTLQAPRRRCSATMSQGSGHQDGVICRARLDRASDDGSNFHPPVTLKNVAENLTLVNPGTEQPEDSSSFHTPNETLEIHSPLSDSPCSSFREDPRPLNFPESTASEVDQMSGVSQPPLSTLARKDEVLRAESFAATQRGKRVEPRELQGLEGCGSISPIEEGSSRKVSEQRSNFTTDTPHRLNAPENAFHLTEELNDDWKRLKKLHSEVQAILFRKYDVRQKLKEKDQMTIMENVLRFHPDYAQKVGCGVDHIKVDNHESHSRSRCFFVVRNDESACDFSYRKCIKSFANMKSPALAMKYDHEYLMKYERGNCSNDVDQFDPFGLDIPSDQVPPWSPRPGHDELGSDLTRPKIMKPKDDVDCDESKVQVTSSKPEESSCETSELKPERERATLSNYKGNKLLSG